MEIKTRETINFTQDEINILLEAQKLLDSIANETKTYDYNEWCEDASIAIERLLNGSVKITTYC